MKTLVLGGARCGKSALAERLAGESGCPVTYIATATVLDDEMAARIDEHRARRPPAWTLVEAPLALADALQAAASPDGCVLVDCLTLWLNNLLFSADEARCRAEREKFLNILPRLPGRILLVSNEVGMGIVPMGEVSRRFCDEAGRLNQAVAALCDQVVWVVAGLPLIMKGKNL
jgi:adenosylcobinamide kinase/adenosylcobinamide-phosphate guanylyltransferase